MVHTGLTDNFKLYLDIEDNNNIFFSGAFGLGKTYFLKNDFFEVFGSDSYFPIHLFPVNYHVASNEDIVTLLKYDILKKLLNESWIDFSKTEVMKYAIAAQKIGVTVLTRFVQSMLLSFAKNKLGLDIKEISEDFLTLIQEKDKIELEIEKIKSFVSKVEQEWFTFDENEFLTQFIRAIIQSKKDTQSQKPTVVLIIDDLDRLDPDHVFRILNVFSAFTSFDSGEEFRTNKLGFDKVIVVADINNIQSIYHHKYGEQTDFEGYIDKFFDLSVFEFGNVYLEDKLYTLYTSRMPGTSGLSTTESSRTVLFCLMRSRLFTYRNYQRLDKKVQSSIAKIQKPNSDPDLRFTEVDLKNYNVLLSHIVEVLIDVYGTQKNVIQVLKKIKNQSVGIVGFADDDSEAVWKNFILKAIVLNYYSSKSGLKSKLKGYVVYTLFGERESFTLDDSGDSWYPEDKLLINSFADIWQLLIDFVENRSVS